jgi:hypothetical protein
MGRDARLSVSGDVSYDFSKIFALFRILSRRLGIRRCGAR